MIQTSCDPKILWNSLGLFSKTCLKIPQLLPTFWKVTFVAHPVLKFMHYLLFSITKNWGISMSDQPIVYLTLSRRRPLSYRNQSIDLLRKLMDWFLYDNGLRLERVKYSFWLWIPRVDWDFFIFFIFQKCKRFNKPDSLSAF